ncbi:uncharacterized protein LAESUDRAFT_816217 [Laetiporus sulphureus 93-53]|uniref:L domain-like protein n=1 Tax=Laetiporus sulphureus 93-53 TaxID=1314785 RepID=A0A165BFM9_9APHY|nr:uncharacterized protein LAESUDRAFT_816217 [Laetiporus sulphureus 93-53]KZT00955.1 hypothetical protein LAESUDRAFT_816217 [Laetiporus sulphureus 93-53]
MSRIPQPPSNRAPSTPAVTSSPQTSRFTARKSPGSTPSRPLRAQQSLQSLKPPKSPLLAKSPSRPPARLKSPNPDENPTPQPKLSIKEQIALKRAQAKKALQAEQSVGSHLDFGGLEDALPDALKKNQSDDELDLGRWSVKEAIERARSSGALNLASRALLCLPSALFEIHLGVKPERLKSVPEEPSISTNDDTPSHRRAANSSAPSWYEAQDLEILKAWSNEIVEIQPEISMFGSLKTVDLHNNRLTMLPASFADLTALTALDLSHNSLTSLPVNLWALPNLSSLNISYNALTSLPFRAPFDVAGANPLARTRDPRGAWFCQSITRASAPLPRLTVLDASHNQLRASSIDYLPAASSLPSQLSKVDLSANPLGECTSLIQALAGLDRLHELHFEHAEIGNDSFPVDIFSSLDFIPFTVLRILDLGETHVTAPVIEAAFRQPTIKQELDFEVTNEEPHEGILRVVTGKKVIKEAWEVEAERRAKLRRHGAATTEGLNIGSTSASSGIGAKSTGVKEAWEIEAEQGLLTEGAKRRARARAAAAAAQASSQSTPAHGGPGSLKKSAVAEKEPWEIEAEQGLLTEGAKRRARAMAAAASANVKEEIKEPAPLSTPHDEVAPLPSPTRASVMSNPQFYDASSRTLTLPPSAPPPKSPHLRSFSHAPSSGLSLGLKVKTSGVSELALALPMPTVPLAAIAAQPLAQTLKVLILTGRKQDVVFSLLEVDGLSLPILEELRLEGCNLPDSVAVARVDSTARTSEPLLPLLSRLFPSLRTLDFSYNLLTSTCLTKDALSSLILASADSDSDASARKGLRHLRLRGNRINELDGFIGIAELFKGNRDCPTWKMEELDLRDNEISKLPPELGLLPLDVLLVDGNLFRVPQRRIWEREGTKGLLSWLRGRIE